MAYKRLYGKGVETPQSTGYTRIYTPDRIALEKIQSPNASYQKRMAILDNAKKNKLFSNENNSQLEKAIQEQNKIDAIKYRAKSYNEQPFLTKALGAVKTVVDNPILINRQLAKSDFGKRINTNLDRVKNLSLEGKLGYIGKKAEIGLTNLAAGNVPKLYGGLIDRALNTAISSNPITGLADYGYKLSKALSEKKKLQDIPKALSTGYKVGEDMMKPLGKVDKESYAYNAGQSLGEAQLGAIELVGSLVAGTAATKAATAVSPTLQALSKMGKTGKFGKVAMNSLEDLVQTGVMSANDISAGRDPRLAENFAMSLGFNTVLPGAASLLKSGAKLAGKGISKITQAGGDLISKATKANDITDELISAAKQAKDRYKQTAFTKFKNAIKDVADPSRAGATIDAKMKVARGDGVEAAMDNSLNYRNKIIANIDTVQSTKSKLSDVIQTRARAGDTERFHVYRNAVDDAIYRSMGKAPLQPSVTTEQLNKIISDYELANPLARQELRTINQSINQSLKEVSGKTVRKELADELMKNEFYTPVARVMPDMEKAGTLTGRNLGSIGQQRVVQQLTGGTQPLDTTWKPIMDYLDRAYKESAQADLAAKILEAHKAGAIDGSKLLVEAGNKQMRKAITGEIKDTTKDIKKLGKKLSLTKRDASKLETAIRQLNKKGKGEISKELKKFVDDYDTKLKAELKPAVKKATRNTPQVTKTADNFTQLENRSLIDPKKLGEQISKLDSAEIRKIKKMIANREPKLAAKLDEVARLKQSIVSEQYAKKTLQESKFEFKDDSTTGLSTISGLENGQKFTLEIPPEIAKTIKGLDIREQGRVVKLAQGVVRGMKTFWTGPLNPLFTIKNILYDTSASVNALVDNPSAFVKSFKPDSIKEMFKSISSKADFQKKIHYMGGSIPGGSQLPTDVAKSAEAIASMRSPLARAGYLIKHPKELLEVSDIMSGKLSGMTRTRIAKGYYADAIKKGMDEQAALKEAVYAYNNIAPNFQRAASLAKSANLISPYFSASVSGARSMLKPIMKHPARALAVYGAISSSFAASAAYNMSSKVGNDFYKDMMDSNNQALMDGNYIIVLPTAYKDEKTGKWNGIVKIPLAPEYRPLNAIIRKQTQQFATGEGGPTPIEFAGKMFDFMTGGSASFSNPLVDTTKIMYGVKPQSSIAKPEPLVSGNMSNLPKKDQKYEFTSEMAKLMSDITGNTVSPIQADALLKQFGFVGSTTTGREIPESFENIFTGAYAKKPTTRYYDIYEPFSARKSVLRKDMEAGKNVWKQVDKYNSELEKAINTYSKSYKADSELVQKLNKLRL